MLPGRPSGTVESAVRLWFQDHGSVVFLSQSLSWSSRILAGGANIQFIRIPERVRIQNGGMKVAHARISRGKNVGRGKKNEWEVLRDQFLHPVIEPLAFGVVERHHLLLHELVNFFFPCRGGLGFAQVPQMGGAI